MTNTISKIDDTDGKIETPRFQGSSDSLTYKPPVSSTEETVSPSHRRRSTSEMRFVIMRTGELDAISFLYDYESERKKNIIRRFNEEPED